MTTAVTPSASTQPAITEGILLAPFAEKMPTRAEMGQKEPLDLSIQEVMRTEVVTVSPDTPTHEIVALLLQKGYRSLPVVTENGRLLGIITDGDLLRRVGLSTRLNVAATDWQEQFAALSQQAATGANLMTAPVITINPADSLHQAVQKMTTHHLKRLPVVAENGRLVGWISRVDILRALDQERPLAEPSAEESEYAVVPRSGASIAELMYQDVPTVSAQAKLEEIVQALEQNRRSRVVVVDENEQVLGIITDGDLLRRIQPEARSGLLARLQGRRDGLQLTGTETAESLMTTPVITISIAAAPEEALPLMLKHGIKRIPVVAENGRLLGLLGRGNLLSGLVSARPADAT